MTRFSTIFTLILAGGVLVAASVVEAAGGHPDRRHADRQLVVHGSPADMEHVAAQYGLRVVGESHRGGYKAVVEGAIGMTAAQIEILLQGDARIESVSRVTVAALPAMSNQLISSSEVFSDLMRTGTFSVPCGSEATWSGYTDQDAVQITGLRSAQIAALGCREVTVAVIDTGIDPRHAAFQGALVEPFDFLLQQAGEASEWSSLDQSVTAITEQSVTAITEQSVTAITEGHGELLQLDSSISPILDQSVTAITEQSVTAITEQLPPSFGHGTMVAGLVRLVAPSARIMPLKVFDGSGQAHLFDIVEAIYYAVDHGADVINMSFSMSESTRELRRAIRYAADRGVVMVAAAGNRSAHEAVYPAAYSEVLGVASTTRDDLLSDFSNHGSGWVAMAAPGSGVISTYPGGAFAAGWGTSFSAPLVAGTAALIHHRTDVRHGTDGADARRALCLGSDDLPGLVDDIGCGRLNVTGTLLQAAK